MFCVEAIFLEETKKNQQEAIILSCSQADGTTIIPDSLMKYAKKRKFDKANKKGKKILSTFLYSITEIIQ